MVPGPGRGLQLLVGGGCPGLRPTYLALRNHGRTCRARHGHRPLATNHLRALHSPDAEGAPRGGWQGCAGEAECQAGVGEDGGEAETSSGQWPWRTLGWHQPDPYKFLQSHSEWRQETLEGARAFPGPERQVAWPRRRYGGARRGARGCSVGLGVRAGAQGWLPGLGVCHLLGGCFPGWSLVWRGWPWGVSSPASAAANVRQMPLHVETPNRQLGLQQSGRPGVVGCAAGQEKVWG